MHAKIVIGIAGMPGSGKATAEKVFKKKYPIIVMGDEVREEARKRKLQPTPENLGKAMLQIRTEQGPAVLAKRCIPKIEAATSGVVVVDGVRSLEEVDEYRKAFRNFVLIAIHASPTTRFRRLLARKRTDDPKNWEDFVARDKRELSVGLGNVVATSDHMIINEGRKDHMIRELNEILRGCLGNG